MLLLNPILYILYMQGMDMEPPKKLIYKVEYDSSTGFGPVSE